MILTGDGEAFSSFGAATGQNFASIFGLHTSPKPVLVTAFPTTGLIGAFHDLVELHIKSCFQKPANIHSGPGKTISLTWIIPHR